MFSAGTLFISRIALPHEQSVAGALFSTMTQVRLSLALHSYDCVLMVILSEQIGTAVGITVTTVVFDTVSGRLRPGEDDIVTYHAAQWTGFAFGIIGKCSLVSEIIIRFNTRLISSRSNWCYILSWCRCRWSHCK